MTFQYTTPTTAQDIPVDNWQFAINTDDIVLSHETIEDRFHQGINLTSTSISDFMQQAFISGDQTPVFAHVYAPISGTREVLVHNQHIPEALGLIKVIKTDLCRIMNHRAIITNFADFDDIILSTTTNDKWEPFDIQLSIERSVAFNRDPNDRKHNKRRRTPTTHWKTLNYNHTEATYANLNIHDTCNDIDLLPDKSIASSITRTTNTTNSFTTTNAYQHPGYSVSNETHNATILADVKMIQELLTNLNNKVDENLENQNRAIDRLEDRCN
jgi:hypothetical protein